MALFPELLIPWYKCACHQPQLFKCFKHTSQGAGPLRLRQIHLLSAVVLKKTNSFLLLRTSVQASNLWRERGFVLDKAGSYLGRFWRCDQEIWQTDSRMQADLHKQKHKCCWMAEQHLRGMKCPLQSAGRQSNKKREETSSCLDYYCRINCISVYFFTDKHWQKTDNITSTLGY